MFQDEFASLGSRAFGISGDRTQNLCGDLCRALLLIRWCRARQLFRWPQTTLWLLMPVELTSTDPSRRVVASPDSPLPFDPSTACGAYRTGSSSSDTRRTSCASASAPTTSVGRAAGRTRLLFPPLCFLRAEPRPPQTALLSAGRDGDNAEDTFLGIYAVVQVRSRFEPHWSLSLWDSPHTPIPGFPFLTPFPPPPDRRSSTACPAATWRSRASFPGGPPRTAPRPACSQGRRAFRPNTRTKTQVSARPPSACSLLRPPQSTAVVLIAVLTLAAPTPPAGDHKYSQPGLYTPTIEEVNRRLAQFAKDSDGCIHYIPCKQCFLKPDGTGIIPDLMRDALHPTGKGMRAWFKVCEQAPLFSSPAHLTSRAC